MTPAHEELAKIGITPDMRSPTYHDAVRAFRLGQKSVTEVVDQPADEPQAQAPVWGSAQAFLPGGNKELLVVRGAVASGNSTEVMDSDDPDGTGRGLAALLETRSAEISTAD